MLGLISIDTSGEPDIHATIKPQASFLLSACSLTGVFSSQFSQLTTSFAYFGKSFVLGVKSFGTSKFCAKDTCASNRPTNVMMEQIDLIGYVFL